MTSRRSTHRKVAARELAAAEGITYQQALTRIIAEAEQGTTPPTGSIQEHVDRIAAGEIVTRCPQCRGDVLYVESTAYYRCWWACEECGWRSAQQPIPEQYRAESDRQSEVLRQLSNRVHDTIDRGIDDDDAAHNLFDAAWALDRAVKAARLSEGRQAST